MASVLVLAPSWFSFYADYLTPTAALCVAVASAPRARSRAGPAHLSWVLAPLATALAAVVTTAFLLPGNSSVQPFPSALLAEAVEPVRCVMSDAPAGLILLDSLSRDLHDGCRDWVDVTGRTYGVDDTVAPGGKHLSRRENRERQAALLGYLRSGQVAIVVRAGGDGLTLRTRAALRRGGVFARAGDVIAYRTRAR